ncbi:MAG: biotin--[acetyl-CoA-carboxylase] ligase [Pirellulales bacterium]
MYRIDELAAHPWLAQLEYASEMGSTNDVALALAAHVPATPLLVLADRQTAGRGRGANRWWSAPGALTFSLVLDLHADLPVARRSQLALVAGLAVRAAIGEQVGGVELKWPNDVYVAGRKVCGILIEASAARPRRAVVGIGVNVNNSFHDAPEDVRQRATSLVDHLPQPLDATTLLSQVLDQFREHLETWEAGRLNLVAEWTPYCFLTNRVIVVETGGRRLSGRCQGITAEGALSLLTPDGPVECLSGVIASVDAR